MAEAATGEQGQKSAERRVRMSKGERCEARETSRIDAAQAAFLALAAGSTHERLFAAAAAATRQQAELVWARASRPSWRRAPAQVAQCGAGDETTGQNARASATDGHTQPCLPHCAGAARGPSFVPFIPPRAASSHSSAGETLGKRARGRDHDYSNRETPDSRSRCPETGGQALDAASAHDAAGCAWTAEWDRPTPAIPIDEGDGQPTAPARQGRGQMESMDVFVEQQEVSLLCPLSHRRIQRPVKGNACAHVQCFDRDSWTQFVHGSSRRICARGGANGAASGLALATASPVPSDNRLRCPICGREVSHLQEDRAIARLLQQAAPHVTKVIVDANWDFVALSPTAEPGVAGLDEVVVLD